MRCRDVDTLWDEVRGDCQGSVKEAVRSHLDACPPCQELYEEYEGVAYRLSALPAAEPSCDLAKRIVEHIAALNGRSNDPVNLTTLDTPIGALHIGFANGRIAYISLDRGTSIDEVMRGVEVRLRRPVVAAEAPEWLRDTISQFFQTWRVDEDAVDISELTAFEQAALRAAAAIPPGEVRSYSWVASQIGRPRAARAVGRVMARNPLPLLFPCHRVVDASGGLHNYGYGLEMKAKLLKMEGYRSER